MRVPLPDEKKRHFPNLRTLNHSVTSEETIGKKVIYNCVAWAAIGDTSKWWQAGTGPSFYWPRGLLSDDSLQSYIALFEFFGYRQCTSDGIEIFQEKIAIYEHPPGEFSHVCYQLFSGWTSKLGGWEDIHHETLEDLEGQLYGKAKIIMKRRCGTRGFLARIFFHATNYLWPLRRPA